MEMLFVCKSASSAANCKTQTFKNNASRSTNHLHFHQIYVYTLAFIWLRNETKSADNDLLQQLPVRNVTLLP